MPKKSAKKYVLPDPLPNGEVLQDIAKKKWILGPSIGVGGFGEIYSAAEYEGPKKPSNYQYVVKIEPHENGPLFCEINFFRRNAKSEMIKTWCSENKIVSLGMPRYLGTGSHEHGNKKYRFLVMDKYGQDLWRIFLDSKRQFPASTVYRICLQLLDVLEYIHSNDYVHADIKGANILLGVTKQTQHQIFLVDFGLATKWNKKEFKPDPRRAHNGTIEYTSCDAHEGVPTRRGDIEILAYNMIQWMGTVLPWEKNLTDPVVVHNSKKKNLADTSEFLKACFGKRKVPGAVKEFLDYVTTMNYDTVPDYKKLRNILSKGLKSEGGSLTGVLEFKIPKHKLEDNLEPETSEKRRRLTPKQMKPGTSKRTGRNTVEEVETFEIDSQSDEENVPVKKTKERRGRKPVEEVEKFDIDSQSEEENIPVKKTKERRGRKPVQVENFDIDSESDEETIPVKKTKERRGRKPVEVEKFDIDSESDEENIPVKKTRSRPKTRENLSDSESEVGTLRGRQKENSVPDNGYNAEMLRIQKKLAEREAKKPKKTVKKTISTPANALSSNSHLSDSDIIENTPPEKLIGRKKRNVNGDVESPRSLRQRR